MTTKNNDDITWEDDEGIAWEDDTPETHNSYWGDVGNNFLKEVEAVGKFLGQSGATGITPAYNPIESLKTMGNIVKGTGKAIMGIPEYVEKFDPLGLGKKLGITPEPLSPNAQATEAVVRPIMHPIQSFREAPLTTLATDLPIGLKGLKSPPVKSALGVVGEEARILAEHIPVVKNVVRGKYFNRGVPKSINEFADMIRETPRTYKKAAIDTYGKQRAEIVDKLTEINPSGFDLSDTFENLKINDVLKEYPSLKKTKSVSDLINNPEKAFGLNYAQVKTLIDDVKRTPGWKGIERKMDNFEPRSPKEQVLEGVYKSLEKEHRKIIKETPHISDEYKLMQSEYADVSDAIDIVGPKVSGPDVLKKLKSGELFNDAETRLLFKDVYGDRFKDLSTYQSKNPASILAKIMGLKK